MRRRTTFLTDKAWDQLQKIADEKGFTISDLIRRAVSEFLERWAREGR